MARTGRANFTTDEISDMVKFYEEGNPLSFVASKFDVSVPTIRGHLVMAGVTIRPRGRRAKSFNETTQDTEVAPVANR